MRLLIDLNLNSFYFNVCNTHFELSFQNVLHLIFDICHVFLQEDQDWGFVAMVMDRLFLWLFMAASVLGTFVILCEAPSLYDDTQPIDTELSIIAKQIFNLSLHNKY